MKRRLLLIKRLLPILPFLIGLSVIFYSSDLNWLGILLGMVGLSIARALAQTLDGKKILWSELQIRDKLIFSISFFIVLVLPLYTIKEKMPASFTLIICVVAYILSFLVRYKFGTEKIKAFLF